MTLNRELLDEYLDGALPQPQALEVEQALANDASARQLVDRLRAQRALRQAAYASYQPSESDARQIASRFMADFQHTPVGIIGHWQRLSPRLARIAAGIAIASACFVGGQYSVAMARNASQSVFVVPPSTGGDTTARTWVVEYQQPDGQTSTREFPNLDAAQKYAHDMSKSAMQVADGGVL